MNKFLPELRKNIHELLDPTSNTSIFTKIYMDGGWGHGGYGSGSGSTIEYNKHYVEFMIEFIVYNKIEKIIDIGCGDWQFSQYMYGTVETEYIGIDCVFPLVNRLKGLYTSPKYKFLYMDALKELDCLPYGDLYIVKDVFQHWDNASICNFLDEWYAKGYSKYLISVNSWEDKDREDIEIGRDMRPLCSTRKPFKKYSPLSLLYYGEEETKEVCSFVNHKL